MSQWRFFFILASSKLKLIFTANNLGSIGSVSAQHCYLLTVDYVLWRYTYAVGALSVVERSRGCFFYIADAPTRLRLSRLQSSDGSRKVGAESGFFDLTFMQIVKHPSSDEHFFLQTFRRNPSADELFFYELTFRRNRNCFLLWSAEKFSNLTEKLTYLIIINY